MAVTPSAEPLSHVFFADDSVLFCRAKENEAYNVKYLLQRYVEGSGQFINLDKSSVHFSVGCSKGLKSTLPQILGIKHQEGFGKYVGIQADFGASKKKVFEEVRNKLDERINGWAEQFLSVAGNRANYSAFLVEGSEDEKGCSLACLEKVAQRKISGGLGFKAVIEFNLAMLAKVGWRLICAPESLLAKVLKAMYYPNSSFLEASVGRGTSWGWKGILQGRKILKSGIRWRVSDGSNIRVIEDPWLPTPRTFRPLSRHPEMPQMVAKLVSIDETWEREIIQRCSFARVFWFGSPIQLDVNVVVGDDFMQCWIWLCAKYGKLEEASTFMRWVVCGLWRIWKCRNSVVFGKVVVEPNVALQLLWQQWKEIVESDKDFFFDNSSGCIGDGTIVNGWCNRTSVGGYGWVARDFAGIFKGVGCVGKVFCASSFMAKAAALRLAVMAAVDRGFTIVHVETNSKVLVDMVHGKLQPDATMEAILWDINLIQQQLCYIEVSYTPRACNEAVHLVASYVTRVGGAHSWDEFEPEWLFNTLASDVNISIRI
ncbi:uncharacterized protein LOC126609285 [Malus sylvestris]|uniref:uncharacterized protein LOC126609285 n=1 Tax=Malus sylvestris TaxID=3752 RepID=UPI0021AD148F|nr:uncharacterized protein LOC126609285 [Malus sylvestris]